VIVAIESACRKRPGVRLLNPNDASLASSVKPREPFRWTVKIGDRFKCGVIPDRVFGLESTDKFGNRQMSWFCLEADRGTMPVTRAKLDQSSFYRKLLAYQATWERNIHRTQFGWHRFRVLTVTTDSARL